VVWHGQSEKGAIFFSLGLCRCPGRSATWQESCYAKKVGNNLSRLTNELVGALQVQRVPEIPREGGGIWLLDIKYNTVKYMSHAVVQIVAAGARENVVLCHFGLSLN